MIELVVEEAYHLSRNLIFARIVLSFQKQKIELLVVRLLMLHYTLLTVLSVGGVLGWGGIPIKE